MSTSITMRRPSPGIHWLVTHLESMTQLLVTRTHGEPSGRAGRLLAREPIFY